MRQMLHVLHLARQLCEERSLHVAGADRVLREDGPIVAGELLPELLRQLACARQLLGLGIGPQRFFGILAELAVDFSGREMCAIEQDLNANSKWRDAVRGRLRAGPFGGIDVLRLQRERGGGSRGEWKREEAERGNQSQPTREEQPKPLCRPEKRKASNLDLRRSCLARADDVHCSHRVHRLGTRTGTRGSCARLL